jgi:signal recognition particle receptor subunit beta
MLRSVSPSPF